MTLPDLLDYDRRAIRAAIYGNLRLAAYFGTRTGLTTRQAWTAARRWYRAAHQETNTQ